MEDKTNYSAIANLINDCFMYFDDDFEDHLRSKLLFELLEVCDMISSRKLKY